MIVRLPRELVRGVVRSSLRQVLVPWLPYGVQRRTVDALALPLRLPGGVRSGTRTLDGVPTTVLTPRAATGRAVLFLHGGGYVTGSAHSHRALVAGVATRLGAIAFVPDYRLAPEHPHPAALDDATACYRALLRSGYSPDSVALAGDSAGAGLALALAVALRDAGEPLPAVLGMISPWVDLALSGESVHARAARDPMLRPDWLRACATAYRADTPVDDPAVSPLHAELAGLPPLVVQSGADEILASDAERLVARAKAARLPVAWREFPGLWHDFQLFAGLLADADAALADFAAALDVRLR